jgi:RNA polymerase sigma-70 factor (ECF subfamily)
MKNDEKSRQDAFEAVVSTYEGPLLRYAARLVNNADAAQDVVQVAFLRLFENWKEEFSPSPKLSNWLYRVTHNCAVDHIRKESRRSELHKAHAEEKPDTVTFVYGGHTDKVLGALAVLDLREKQLVLLKVFEEKSYREISEITGLTVTNVGYILHTAMKKMATQLKEEKAI